MSEKEDKLAILLEKLEEKMGAVGEDLQDHLEGLLYSYYINYWDYIGVDALLNLQKPKTKYPDEMTFIIYHQITELYFKLIIHELERIGHNDALAPDFFKKHMKRINHYFEYLINSFDVMIQGMDRSQFMHFRKAITPASGFQSIQYRLIELWSTQMLHIVHKDKRDRFTAETPVKELCKHLYWKEGATNKDSGEKTLTLVQFEEKYGNLMIRKGKEFLEKNLWYRYTHDLTKEQQEDPELIAEMKRYDQNANINWPLAHYKQAVTYLIKGNKISKSTGNTNWQQYLPPKFQQQMFFPKLWTTEELENWGKTWVESNVYASSLNTV